MYKLECLILCLEAKTSSEVNDEGRQQLHLNIKRLTGGGGTERTKGNRGQGGQCYCCPWSFTSEKSWPQDEISSVGFEIWHQIPLIISIQFPPTLHSGLTTCGHPAASRHRVFREWRGTSTGPQSWASWTTSWKNGSLILFFINEIFKIFYLNMFWYVIK